MTHVCVVIYNRFENLQHWISCWQKCNRENAELVIVHNFYGDNELKEKLKTYCEKNDIKYVPRDRQGFDIGAFQDVVMDRLEGFPAWERLLWIADDTFPMSYNFVQQFESKMAENVGVVCMKISPYVRSHIRTTGFMIDRATAKKLVFPASLVTTKAQCYAFEHRDKINHFKAQLDKLKLQTVQVSPDHNSPLWDTGYHRRLDRTKQHEALFGPIITEKLDDGFRKGVVTFICTIQNGYPQIISSLLMQTVGNWELWLIHNGKAKTEIDLPDDPRIKYIETETDTGNWGHPNRAKYLQEVKTEYVVITNNDNYHVPGYTDLMLRGFKSDTVGVYCSDMVHSYIEWRLIPCRLARGYIDCAGMMLRTKEAQQVGWNNVTDHSADWFFFNDLIRKYGVQRFVKVRGCLLTHN